MEIITSNNQIRIDYTVARLRWEVIANIVTNKVPCITCFTCFSFFKNKMFPFLNNVNDEVSSKQKDEVATMMATVPKI